MGVDWYACNNCGTTFPDCGPHGYCGNCEERLCDYCTDKMIEKFGQVDEDSEAADYFGTYTSKFCDGCDPEVVRDEDILQYLLSRQELTREELTERILDLRKGIAK